MTALESGVVRFSYLQVRQIFIGAESSEFGGCASM